VPLPVGRVQLPVGRVPLPAVRVPLPVEGCRCLWRGAAVFYRGDSYGFCCVCLSRGVSLLGFVSCCGSSYLNYGGMKDPSNIGIKILNRSEPNL
jgi:hypothetical protein